MANILGIIRNKASGVAGAVKLFINGNKQTQYKKCELVEYMPQFMSKSTLPYSFYQGSAVVLNDEIHILGGNGNSKNHYKWDGNSWTSVSTLPYSFYQGSAVVLNDEIHLLGSYYSSTGETKHYKWDGNSWTSASTLPYEFGRGSAVTYKNEIHLLGSDSGASASPDFRSHYKWDGSSWTIVSTLPYNFYDGNAVILNDEINILGDANSSYSKYHYYLLRGIGKRYKVILST